ncbi:MAG TPA: GNAT family N-acetyltransferase [Longimicrobiaceae bacterium]|nr:GNAT family N-acetyltransferase [Longimicrobiaceae bacterium]
MTGGTAAVRVVDADPRDPGLRRRMAELLVEGFREMAPEAWPDLASAAGEVTEAFAPDRTCRVAVDGDGSVLGWIGALPMYDGNVWELHPLVVDAARRQQGIGRALVADLEERAREAGAVTMYLGSDDVAGMTSLGGVDLFPGALERLREIRSLRGHPFEFYRRCGYEVVGVLPDANGPGKPDIFMAKSLRGRGG